MFSWVRRRATFANAAMVVAVVFAMSGGAFAAGKYLITSTKQISPKVLKQLKGAKGPRGEAGPAGPAGKEGPVGKEGAPGKEGKAGASGSDGKDGESVASASLKPGEGGCAEGGAKFTVGGKETTACNGEKGAKGAAGEPWTPNNTLPSEATETGTWSFGPETREGERIVAIASFPIQLVKALGETQVHVVERSDKTIVQCPGTPDAPSATPGNFCLYVENLFGAEIGGILDSDRIEFGAGKAGAFLILSFTKMEAEGQGTWAVTAE